MSSAIKVNSFPSTPRAFISTEVGLSSSSKIPGTDRHPSEVGKIELPKGFLKAMVERANTGEMVVLRVAMWERTSRAGMQYKNFKLELDRPAPTSSEEIAQEREEEDKDVLPF